MKIRPRSGQKKEEKVGQKCNKKENPHFALAFFQTKKQTNKQTKKKRISHYLFSHFFWDKLVFLFGLIEFVTGNPCLCFPTFEVLKRVWDICPQVFEFRDIFQLSSSVGLHSTLTVAGIRRGFVFPSFRCSPTAFDAASTLCNRRSALLIDVARRAMSSAKSRSWSRISGWRLLLPGSSWIPVSLWISVNA